MGNFNKACIISESSGKVMCNGKGLKNEVEKEEGAESEKPLWGEEEQSSFSKDMLLY